VEKSIIGVYKLHSLSNGAGCGSYNVNMNTNTDLENLTIKSLIEASRPNCAAIRVLITYQGVSIEYENKSPIALKMDGISMRNIKGEWIK
jgi:hypothetical protein